MKEFWKRLIIDGNLTRYEISNNGQIHDLKKDTYTYGNVSTDGYMQYTFYLDNGESKTKLVHRLVAELFIPKEKEEYDVVDHINSNRKDNRVNNLRWCTSAMNTQYAKEKGSLKKEKGEKSPRHKYTLDQIMKVIELLKTGKYKVHEIAKIARVNSHTVSDILAGKTWNHLYNVNDFSVIDSHKKFSDEQIMEAIKMLNGKYTIKEISEITGVAKSVIRSIYKREIYTYITCNIPNLSYKKISSRANSSTILLAISYLETGKYTRKEVSELTGLSRSVIEKLVYKQRWTDLTKGKKLRFKNSLS